MKVALEESGIDTKELMVSAVSQISIDNGRMAALEFLKKNPDITALVCYNEVLALGVLEACWELGIKVPDDLSLVGFDNIRETERSSPPLTTIEIDKQAIGVDMMKRLIDSIDSKEKNFERVMVPVQLIERMSSAPLKT